MPLTLEVVGAKAAKMGTAVRKVFQAGGTIGRHRDNDWVFPDEYISGRHARISFADGGYLIEDTSTNGVFVNSPQNRLTRGQPYRLRSGDTLFIDDYEVRVTLSAQPVVEPQAPATASLIPDDPFSTEALGSVGAPTEADPLKLLGLQDAPAVPPGPSAAGLASQSPLSQHYRPPPAAPPPRAAPPRTAPASAPRVAPASAPRAAPSAPARPAPPAPAARNLIPDDYDPLGSDELALSAKAPAPAVVPAAPPPQPAAFVPQAPTPAPFVAPTPAAFVPQAQPPAAPPAGARRPTPRPPAAEPPRAPPPARPAVNPARPAAPAPSQACAAAPELPAGPSTESTSERRGLGAGLDLAELLAGAGIDGSRVSAELAQQFGQILRVVVAGVMDVLRARERIKDEFRMRMTTFKPADNNPLKFSANVEDALHNLLVKRNAAYLGPVEAFEDAFADVRNHQMAMLAGVRVAYEAMLAGFEPGRLQEEFDRQLKTGSFLSGPAKHKYWELYRNKYHDMVKDADTSFRNLFGDEFAKAYEEQLARLKTLDRAERR
jgi:type VI secretion system FHA domain protein